MVSVPVISEWYQVRFGRAHPALSVLTMDANKPESHIPSSGLEQQTILLRYPGFQDDSVTMSRWCREKRIQGVRVTCFST
eukprot:2310245-Rhodomonas_salina.7